MQGSHPHRRPGSLRARRLACGIAALLVAAGSVAASGAGSGTDAGQESRLVWTGNYESHDFSQWEQVLRETFAGSARIVAKPVAQGRYAARFELGPQLAYEYSRIEAHQPDPISSGGRYGAETWYRWAEFVPSASSFARHGSFNHLFQWHPTVSCFGAALSVNGLARPVRLLFNVRGGAILDFEGGCEFQYDRAFDLGPLPRDRWLRFRLHIKWHADPDVGFVELWMNGGRKVKRTYLATAAPNVHHYVRQGIYRFRCDCRTVVYGDAMTVTQVAP